MIKGGTESFQCHPAMDERKEGGKGGFQRRTAEFDKTRATRNCITNGDSVDSLGIRSNRATNINLVRTSMSKLFLITRSFDVYTRVHASETQEFPGHFADNSEAENACVCSPRQAASRAY